MFNKVNVLAINEKQFKNIILDNYYDYIFKLSMLTLN